VLQSVIIFEEELVLRKRMTKLAALLLTMVMVITTFTGPAYAAARAQEAVYNRSHELSYIANDMALPGSSLELSEDMPYEHLDFLLSTLTHEPLRMFGFEGNYALPDNPDEMIEIIVQFRTPPAVAQRLAQEVGSPRARLDGRAMDAAFVSSALEGHANFMNELSSIPMPFSAMGGMEIFSEHHMLFNGVFMRVSVSMAESIAMLPEVFSVSPAMIPYSLQDLDAMASGTYGIEQASDLPWHYRETLNSNLDNNGVLTVPSNFKDYEYEWHPEFNQGARELFELDYINENIATGAGIRVGIIDTGVDYRHPAYWHMLIPVADGMGFVRDEAGQYWSLPGGNFLTGSVSGRATGRGTSPMEMIHGAAHSTHGTHVAGIALGMAPDIQLYAFRILTAEPGGGALPDAPLRAIEYAYYLGLDVVNNSWGYTGNSNHPWFAFTFATNIAALAGQLSTNGTGNDGMGGAGANNVPGNGGWFSVGGGSATASLGISVASGQGGNRHQRVAYGATVGGVPTDILLTGTSQHSADMNALFGQDMDYVWFNRMQLPAGGRTNSAFAPFMVNVKAMLDSHGIDSLDGKVVVINRGGGEFVTMLDMAVDLGAVALVVINNTAANTHLSGVTLNNAGQPIPAFSVRLNEGNAVFGQDNGTPVPVEDVVPIQGLLCFGELQMVKTPDIITPSSSIGPMGPVGAGDSSEAIMQIFPSILAPGNNIVSTWTISHPTNMDGRSYNAIGGTSMSGPAVAGIVALMLEHFDAPMAQSNNREGRAVEIRARLMQTATRLADYDGHYSVNQVGAGLINPLGALQTTAFATTVHSIPFGHGVTMDDLTYQTVAGHLRVFANHTMSSLSLGRVSVEENEFTTTDTFPITIHGDGNWAFDRLEMRMPTQELRNPATGNWTGNWGPQLQFTVTGVNYYVEELGNNEFEIYFTHDGVMANRGFAEGHIYFTDGNGGEIFMIFGAYFDVQPPLPPPTELSLRANTGIWRPVISGFVSPNVGVYDDPREFPAGWLANPGLHIMTAQSNYSPVTFGFNDESLEPLPRNVRFYIGPYGVSLGDPEKRFHTVFNNVAPNSNVFSGNLLRPMVGGSLWNITGQPSWHAGDGYLLAPGLYTLTMFVANPGGEDLVAPFHFAVTTSRPTITFDQEVFVYEEGDTHVTVTGRVSSLGHDLAIENNLIGMTAFTGSIDLVPGSTGLFDYSQSTLWVPVAPFPAFPVNADGTFSIEWPIAAGSPTTVDLRVTDGEGVGIVPNILGQWNSVVSAAANQSVSTSFTYADCLCDPCPDCGECVLCSECIVVGFNIFNNGPGGTQYPRPNASLAAAGTIRMWTQLDGVNAPVYLDAADTIVALDQNGQCAMEFVRVGRVWVAGTGWADYFNMIDVNKDGGSWQYINFSVTVLCQVVEVLLVNALFEPPVLPEFGWNIFNNGPGGTQYPRPNPGLAAAGTIRMWTQLDGVNAPVYFAAADTIVALDQDGENAMEFVTVNRMWVAGTGWIDYFNMVNVNKNGQWEYINLTITVYGETVHVLLANALFEPPAEDVTVTFVVEAGAVGVYAATTTTVVVPAGEEIPAVAIPSTEVRTGFYFAGWYPSDPTGYVVTEDITFTARFNPLFHNVTFEAGNGGELIPAAGFGLVVNIRDGFTFWADRVPTPVPNAGYVFIGWYPADPAGYVVRDSMTFTALFAVPQIVSVTPNSAVVEQGGTVELVVTTLGMPDGAWVDLNVVWRPGLSIVGGPRFYIVDGQAIITVAAAENAPLGRDGFSVAARTTGDWGSVVLISSYAIVIEVI